MLWVSVPVSPETLAQHSVLRTDLEASNTESFFEESLRSDIGQTHKRHIEVNRKKQVDPNSSASRDCVCGVHVCK